jgi:hypothetical protein
MLQVHNLCNCARMLSLCRHPMHVNIGSHFVSTVTFFCVNGNIFEPQHPSIHTSGEMPEYKCATCGASFINRRSWKVHVDKPPKKCAEIAEQNAQQNSLEASDDGGFKMTAENGTIDHQMNSHDDFIALDDTDGNTYDTANDEAYEPSEPEQVRIQRPVVAARRPLKRLVKTAIRTKAMGGTEMLSNEFVALANSLKGSIKQRALFMLVLKTVLKEKCAEMKLTRSVVEKLVGFLQSDQVIQESHFNLEKHALFHEFFDHTFTPAQMKVIADLSQLEITEENVKQQLIFATYFGKTAKLMLKYKLASTSRSKECVGDVTDVLQQMSYDDDNCVTPVTWYEKLVMFPREAVLATWPYVVVVALAVLAVVVLLWRYVRVVVAKVDDVQM